MKQNIFKIFSICALAFSICLAISSCRKASDNGKLDGQWQIMSIEQVSTGEPLPVNKQLYFCINLHVMHLTQSGSISYSGNMFYDKDAGTLSCDFPYADSESALNNLHQWGVYSNPVNFEILKLDGKNLVLKTDATIISCRRF